MPAPLDGYESPSKQNPSVNKVDTTKTVDPLKEEHKPNQAILGWKKFLKDIGMYSGNVDSDEMDEQFKSGMQALEGKISKDVPSVVGMIWSSGNINPQASIVDVQEALKLLDDSKKKDELKPEKIASKFGRFERFAQANMDALDAQKGDPLSGTPFSQMFISQDATNIPIKDNLTPTQTAALPGVYESKSKEKSSKIQDPKTQNIDGIGTMSIDDRMSNLTKLMGDLSVTE